MATQELDEDNSNKNKQTPEEALRESEEHLSAIFSGATVGLSEVSIEGKFLRVNAALCNILGRTSEELTSLSVTDVTIAEDVPASIEALHELLNTGAPASLDKRYKKPNGDIVWANSSLSLLKIEGRQPRMLVVTVDLTERKQVEDRLRNSEDRFRTLTHAVPQLVWANDLDGNAIFFNQGWFEYTGLSYVESAGPGWRAVVHPYDAAVSATPWQVSIATGQVFDKDCRLRRADGIYRWHIVRNVPVRDNSGNITEWVGSATDIEDIKKTEEALRESKERLRITMESATDYAIMTLDTNGDYTSWSKGAEKAFGYTEEEAAGQHSSLIFTPEDKKAGAPKQEINQAINEGRAEDERWHIRKDGSRFFVSGVMTPIMNEETLIGFVKVARDMTERKLMEQQKDEFIGIASHELKTPVTSIKSYVEVLQEILEEDNNQQNALLMKKLNMQVDRLIELIHSLLDTTKISEGQLILQKQMLDINELIAASIDNLKYLSQNHKITFARGETRPVVADNERIEQVLVNIVSNAIKYSPKGGEVLITTMSDENSVTVSVRDEGIGISAEVKDKIFDRFYRVNDVRISSFPGMGLGLYITNEIIKNHKGKMWVESIPGEGSTFYFSIPYPKN
jgi:PAS domain S-box-containing protein